MKQFILIFFSCFLSSPLWAQETCFTRPSDPFNVSLRFTEGKHKGSCIYTEVRRNIRLVKESTARNLYRISIKNGRVLVANFRHQNHFWIASIPMNKIERTFVQEFSLFGPFSHLQLRFVLQPGEFVELTPQDLNSHQKSIQINDFVFALHALRAVELKDQTYSPVVEGLFDGYGVAYNMRSTEEDLEDLKKSSHLVIRQSELDLTPSQQNQLLWNRLALANRVPESQLYNTATQSCVTATLEGIYQVVPNTFLMWFTCDRSWTMNLCPERNLTGGLERFSFKTPFNPAAAVDRLRKQGYIKDVQIPDLRSEFLL